MLTKNNRLLLKKHFQNVFRGGKTAESRLFKIKFLGNQKKYARFGFIISNKFSKKAVQRNLVKRRLRAAAKLFLNNIKSGFDIIIWPKAGVKNIRYQELIISLKNLLNKNDIISL